MIKEREQQINNIFGVFDVILSVISFAIAYFIRDWFFEPPIKATQEYIIIGLLIIPTWFILIKSVHLAEIHRTKSYSMIFASYLKVVVVGLGVIFLSVFILQLHNISRMVILVFGVANLFSLFGVRLMVYRIMKYFRVKGYNTRNVVVIADESSEEFIEKIKSNKEWGYRLNYIITNSSYLYRKYKDEVKVHTERINLRNLIDIDVVDEVIYCKNEINQNNLKSIIHDCEEVGVVFRMQSQLFSKSATKTHLNHFDDTPFLTFDNTPSDHFAFKLKNTLSVLAAFFILLVWSPVLLGIAIVIKLTSKGPVFFKQKRVGLRGRTFFMYKFRTMVTNAEELKAALMEKNEADGPVFKIKNDPRITGIGKILRKTGLDELPQFINVLKGDMSLVGPRPPIPEEVKQYERWQLRRLSMKPGITCTWQIKPNRNDISFDEWMKMDLHYIDNWSNKLDLVLFFKTIKTMLKGSGS
ncbi:MAG: sugar transferase [Bacteroidales bacterium]|nr:sugar transferase [Bacteroidales bacterium]MCF8405332.1 sugar transferase [Bacteroidales bacterium]